MSSEQEWVGCPYCNPRQFDACYFCAHEDKPTISKLKGGKMPAAMAVEICLLKAAGKLDNSTLYRLRQLYGLRKDYVDEALQGWATQLKELRDDE